MLRQSRHLHRRKKFLVRGRACGNPGVLVIRPEVGFMSLEEVGDGLELFAREVLPVVREL